MLEATRPTWLRLLNPPHSPGIKHVWINVSVAIPRYCVIFAIAAFIGTVPPVVRTCPRPQPRRFPSRFPWRSGINQTHVRRSMSLLYRWQLKHYPLTEPANRPRTKYRCRAKNTANGTTMEIKAPAVSRCQSWPRSPTRFRSTRDRKSTRLNSSHPSRSRMPSSAWKKKKKHNNKKKETEKIKLLIMLWITST